MIYEYLVNKKRVVLGDDLLYPTQYAIKLFEHFNKKSYSKIEGYRLLLLNVDPYVGIKLQI